MKTAKGTSFFKCLSLMSLCAMFLANWRTRRRVNTCRYGAIMSVASRSTSIGPDGCCHHLNHWEGSILVYGKTTTTQMMKLHTCQVISLMKARFFWNWLIW